MCLLSDLPGFEVFSDATSKELSYTLGLLDTGVSWKGMLIPGFSYQWRQCFSEDTEIRKTGSLEIWIVSFSVFICV